jgi:hypothetical protein
VLRRELLRALHVERPALHAHVAVRLDDGPPALLLAPLRDLGEGAAVRVGHVGRVRLRLRARVVEEGDERLHVSFHRRAGPRVEQGGARDVLDEPLVLVHLRARQQRQVQKQQVYPREAAAAATQ